MDATRQKPFDHRLQQSSKLHKEHEQNNGENVLQYLAEEARARLLCRSLCLCIITIKVVDYLTLCVSLRRSRKYHRDVARKGMGIRSIDIVVCLSCRIGQISSGGMYCVKLGGRRSPFAMAVLVLDGLQV